MSARSGLGTLDLVIFLPNQYFREVIVRQAIFLGTELSPSVEDFLVGYKFDTLELRQK